MTDALEGTAPRKPTLTEQANSARIGRGRFIGNIIGAALIVVVVEIGLALLGLRETRTFGATTVIMPNRWSVSGAGLIFLLISIDLAVRRRHDRGQSGGDCVALFVLGELIGIGSLFGLLDSIPPLVLAVVYTAANLYTFVVLAVLPGDRGPNAYGPPPLKD